MKKGYGRNYWALTFEGTFFIGGIVVLSTGGVVALYINTMTGSNTLIGLAITLQALLMSLGQLLGAPYLNSIRKLPEFLFKTMAVQRTIPLLMAIPLFLGVSGYLSVTIFLILFALFWFFDGAITLYWGELCARALKPDLRGHMMGIQTTLGGFLQLLAGLLIAWLLATPTLNDNIRYAIIFVLGGIMFLMTVVFIRLVRDPSPILKPEKVNVKQFYDKIPSIIRHSKPLKQIIIARLPSYIGFASVSFLVVFGVNALTISDAQVSWLVYANIIGGIISGVLLGEASRRYGNRAVILLCNFGVVIAMCMAVLLAYNPSLGYVWLFAICMLGSLTASNWFGYFNYFIDIAPVKERSAYQLIGQAIGIPFSFAGVAMGAVIDIHGYVTTFIICGIFAFITCLFSIRLLSKKKMAVLAAENSVSESLEEEDEK